MPPRSSRLLRPSEEVEEQQRSDRKQTLDGTGPGGIRSRLMTGVADFGAMMAADYAAMVPAGLKGAGAALMGREDAGDVTRRAREQYNVYPELTTEPGAQVAQGIGGVVKGIADTEIAGTRVGTHLSRAEDKLVAMLGSIHPKLAGAVMGIGAAAIEVVDAPVGSAAKSVRMGRKASRLLEAGEGGTGNLSNLDNWIESSLDKQGAVGTTFQHMVDGSPEYKEAVFNDWKSKHPEIVEQSGATNYDELVKASYDQLKKEIDIQYAEMIDSGLTVEWDSVGDRGYKSSKALSDDIRNNNRMVVFKGGEKHDMLGDISEGDISYNDKFRGLHDKKGHEEPQTTFGAKGEEAAWFTHSGQVSPLAKAALTTETRGQNSWVNYSAANAQQKRALKNIEIAARRRNGRKMGDTDKTVKYTDEEQAIRSKLYAGTKYAPQKAGLLPVGMTRQDYVRGTLDEIERIKGPAINGTPVTGIDMTGYHYVPIKHGPQTMTDPSRIGSGNLGADRGPVESMPESIQPQSFFYTKPDSRESMINGTQYKIDATNVYDLDADPEELVSLSKTLNQANELTGNPSNINEWQQRSDVKQLIRSRGYNGMYSPSAVKRGHGTPDAFVMFEPQYLHPMGETPLYHGTGVPEFNNTTPLNPFGGFDDKFAPSGVNALGHAHYLSRAKSMSKQYVPDSDGGVLQVNMPNSDLNKMLDWNKPMDEQPFVRDAVNKVFVERGLDPVDPNMHGAEIFTRLEDEFGYDKGIFEQKLRDQGVLGVKDDDFGVTAIFKAADIAPIQSRNGKGQLDLINQRNRMRIAIADEEDIRSVSNNVFDERFDDRKKESSRLSQLTTKLEGETPQVDPVSIYDLEGQPFITSMSDRTAAGSNLIGINGVDLDDPVKLMGGQDYMFNNPGQVWASAQNPANAMHTLAAQAKESTGKNPLFLPWRMAPSSGDFSHMTGETMLSYAASNMNKKNIAKANTAIKRIIPEWSGIGTPGSTNQFRDASNEARKQVKGMLDVRFRDEGGLGLGEARLATTDPRQLSAADGGLMNVGMINPNRSIITESGHPSYPNGLPGEGIGRLTEDIDVFQLLPEVVKQRGMQHPLIPTREDRRALMMKPYSGVITEDVLRQIEHSRLEKP